MKQYVCCFILLCVFPLFAQGKRSEIIDGQRWIYTVADGKARVTKGPTLSNVRGTLLVPSKLGGFPVTAISDLAFGQARKSGWGRRSKPTADFSPVTVIIPEGVTEIGSVAFGDCKTLESVILPSSVTKIGESAFVDCTALSFIELPDNLTEIGTRVFANCTSLSFIELPDSLTKIGKYSFSGCTALRFIDIPDNVTSIGDRAFDSCISLRVVKLPECLTEIGEEAFDSCSTLTSVTIPKNVTTIGKDAFSRCFSLMSAGAYVHSFGVNENKVRLITSSQSVSVSFQGSVPDGFSESGLLGRPISYPDDYQEEWKRVLNYYDKRKEGVYHYFDSQRYEAPNSILPKNELTADSSPTRD